MLATPVPAPYVLAAVLAALAAVLGAVGMASTVRWRFLDRRLREYVWTDEPESPLAPEVALSIPAAGVAPQGDASRRRMGGRLQRRLARTSYAARMQARLARAGSVRRAADVILAQAVCGSFAAGLASVVLTALGPGMRLLAAVVVGGVAATVPLLLLDATARRRQGAFERQLPQAIDAMASSLRAGSTLHQALAVLAREMTPPISVEFGRVLRETEVGLTFADALGGLSTRIPSDDLTLFISAVSIQQRVGGDLSQILRSISHTIRERLRVRGEMRVLTAQARYSSYIVAGLPVGIFLFLWATNGSYVAPMFQPGIGRYMLIGAATGIFLGFQMMNRLARVDV